MPVIFNFMLFATDLRYMVTVYYCT